jgi:hypothetical protein
MINSTLVRIYIQGISLVSLFAILFEAIPFSPFLAPSWNKEEEKERVEMDDRVAGMSGTGVLLLGK